VFPRFPRPRMGLPQAGGASGIPGAARYRFRSRVCGVPRLTIRVRGGVAELISEPRGVEVVIVDCDVDGTASARLERDDAGHPCNLQRDLTRP
jgi:hypothetical protein